jgi:DNA-binding NarL/FixJ family response regulator
MDVLVIVLCGTIHVGLARASVRQGWTVLALGTAVQAMREIRDHCPRLVVVQVTLLNHEPIKLIRLLHQSSQPMLIVAVANGHRQPLERLVRDAGASCYLPSAENEGPLVDAVSSMLGHAPVHSASGVPAGVGGHFEPLPLLRQGGNKGLRQ